MCEVRVIILNRSTGTAGVLPFSSSMRAGMMPDFANMTAQASSMDTVPIIMTTSRMRSSSAESEIQTCNVVSINTDTAFQKLTCWLMMVNYLLSTFLNDFTLLN